MSIEQPKDRFPHVRETPSLALPLPGARGWDYTTFVVPWLRLYDPEDGLNLRMALSSGGCFPKEKEGARRSVPLS